MLLSIFLACYPTYNAQNFPEDPGHDYDNDGLTELEGDCDDLDGLTYLGAAFNESLFICMTDQDGDGYGDSNPATGVSPGTDCDDTDPLLETSDDDLDGYSTCTGDCDDEDSSLNLLDNDNDGYSTCTGDCDDTNPDATAYDGDGDGSQIC